MYKTFLKVIVFFILIYSASAVNAHEIHMKDGRIIESETVWEENDIVKYQKYEAIIGIKKNLVKKIIYNEEPKEEIALKFKPLSIVEFIEIYPKPEMKDNYEVFLNDGHSSIVSKYWVNKEENIFFYEIDGNTFDIPLSNVREIKNVGLYNPILDRKLRERGYPQEKIKIIKRYWSQPNIRNIILKKRMKARETTEWIDRRNKLILLEQRLKSR